MTIYYAAQGGSRILNANRVDQSGSDNADVINWVKTNNFILAVNINSGGKDTAAAQYKLRWRIALGTFADVASTGAIKFGATDLVQGASILVAGRKCDSQGGDTWQNGEEVEGTALSDAIDLPDEYETEVHFSLSCADAADNSTYEFELYDGTLGASVGTCGATLKTAAGAQNYNQPVAGVLTILGIIGKSTGKFPTGSFTSTGIVIKQSIFTRTVTGILTLIDKSLTGVMKKDISKKVGC